MLVSMLPRAQLTQKGAKILKGRERSAAAAGAIYMPIVRLRAL